MQTVASDTTVLQLMTIHVQRASRSHINASRGNYSHDTSLCIELVQSLGKDHFYR